MSKVQQMMNYLTNPKDVAKALNNLSKVNSFRYKNFFTVPKVKVEWRRPDKTHMYGRLTFSINRKPVRGSIQFDHPFFFQTQKETQKWLDSWLSTKLTPVINSVENKASLNRAKAKKIVEQHFKVRVI